MKTVRIVLAVVLAMFPLFAASAGAAPKAPTLLTPQIISSTQIRWRFKNNEPKAVAFELWNVLARAVVLRVDNPKATYIDETNVVPADPDMACGRYVVAVTADGHRSYGQKLTYPCVRTPPVAPSVPKVEIVEKNILRVTASSGANDPATAVGIYESNRGNWVSPQNMFVANPEMLTPGEWGSDMGTTLIGLRPNSSYSFSAVARSVTGEVSKFTAPVVFRMPMEKGDAFAPSLGRLGENENLFGKPLDQTLTTKNQQPVIAGIAEGSAVTVTLDDRPYQAKIKGLGEVKSFSFVPPFKIGSGYHYLRLGVLNAGNMAWTPTIEFKVLRTND